jgi:hypothetical protein
MDSAATLEYTLCIQIKFTHLDFTPATPLDVQPQNLGATREVDGFSVSNAGVHPLDLD